MKEVTILTPTYNRAATLSTAYESLKKQTTKDFIWLIIDDGSSDYTEDLVNSWMQENIIEIKYVKKKNGGKHTAINFAYNYIKTEYVILTLDSDDYFKDNTIEFILKNLDVDGGLVFLCDDENGEHRYCFKFDEKSLQDCSIREGLSNNFFNAGAIFVLKVEYAKKILFPEFEGEKFFSEAYFLYQYDYKVKWCKEFLCIREFRNDGLTKNIYKTYLTNPNSWYCYNAIRYKNTTNILKRLKYVVYMLIFSILRNKSIYLENNCNPIILSLLYPFGVLGVVYLKIKDRMEKNK